MDYVLYTHTDYLDVLKIHSDYLKFKSNILLINHNDMNLDFIYNKFTKIIFYDDNLPYASRILSFIENYEEKGFLLIHDIDIPLSIKVNKLENLFNNFLIKNNIHRIDLQQDARTALKKDLDNFLILNDDNLEKTLNYEKELLLVKNDSLSHGIYNVNPSFWKTNILKEILSKFKEKSYRTIESPDVQNYCLKFNFFKLHSFNWINSGYYRVVPEFMFLHITHGGGLMPIKNTADKIINDEYQIILSKYSFTKEIKINMY